jgi:hypothetical protein
MMATAAAWTKVGYAAGACCKVLAALLAAGPDQRVVTGSCGTPRATLANESQQQQQQQQA